MTLQNFINGLNLELSLTKDFSNDDVFNAFEKYVENKDILKKAITFGLFHYDYIKYKEIFLNTLFEEGISLIIDMQNNAKKVSSEKVNMIFEDGYHQISKGYASFTQLMWLQNPQQQVERLDVFAKQVFNLIGDIIENSLKPFFIYLNSVRCILQNRDENQNKLGLIVDALKNYSPIFKGLYMDLMFGISISQWRNIAAHGDYRCINNKIEIEYGPINKKIKKHFNRNDILSLYHRIDALFYMHKIAITLMSIDNKTIITNSKFFLEKSPLTMEDDIISQIVETAFTYGFQVSKIDVDSNPWQIEAITSNKINNKEILLNFLNIIANLVKKDFIMCILHGEKVEYYVDFKNHELKVFKFRV